MSRLQKKCLMASTLAHTFLGLVLILSTAFFVSERKPPPRERLRVIPTKLIDEAFSGGGGSPKAPPTDAQMKAQPVPPPPAPPPRPVPPKPKPKPKSTPPKITKPKPAPRKTAAKVQKPRPKPTKVAPPKIKLKPITRSYRDREAERVKQQARADMLAQRQAANRVSRVLKNLRDGFQQGTVVQTHGSGGAAYANYAQFVKAVYEDAWIVTGDFEDDNATATVTVTITRDGYVQSARISKRSGNALLDRTVQQALDKVKYIRPFPAGARESSRTFTINFNLKAKRLIG